MIKPFSSYCGKVDTELKEALNLRKKMSPFKNRTNNKMDMNGGEFMVIKGTTSLRQGSHNLSIKRHSDESHDKRVRTIFINKKKVNHHFAPLARLLVWGLPKF